MTKESHLLMGQAFGWGFRTFTGSLLASVRSISSSQLNGGGELSSKTLPAVTQQEAKPVWTQDNPTTLLSWVVSQTGLTVRSTSAQTLPNAGCPRGTGGSKHLLVFQDLSEGKGKGEVCM